MAPFTGWYQGPRDIGRLISAACPAEGPGDLRMLPARANGQPAFGMYHRHDDGDHHAFGLRVRDVTADGVAHAIVFFDPGLFPAFDLPPVLPGSSERG